MTPLMHQFRSILRKQTPTKSAIEWFRILMRPFVNITGCFLCESFRATTMTAFERSFAGMNSQMRFQHRKISEFFATMRTSVRFGFRFEKIRRRSSSHDFSFVFAFMRQFVLTKRSRMSKTPIATIAIERLFAAMGPLVRPKGCRLNETLQADFAFVSSFVSVTSFVHYQRCLLGKTLKFQN